MKSYLFTFLTVAIAIVPSTLKSNFRKQVANLSSIESGNNPNTAFGTVLLKAKGSIDFNKILRDINERSKITTMQSNDPNTTSVTILSGDTVISLAYYGSKLPGDDLNDASEASQLWPEAKNVAPRHEAFILVSIASPSVNPLNKYKLLTIIMSVVLNDTDAIGIYFNMQELVLPKNLFLAEASTMNDQHLPVLNWIYFGTTEDQGKISGFTNGLKEFGLDEIEIIHSGRSAEEIYNMLLSISHYLLLNNIKLRDGETFAFNKDKNLKVKRSGGVRLPGTTLKIEF